MKEGRPVNGALLAAGATTSSYVSAAAEVGMSCSAERAARGKACVEQRDL